ncbi:hypothetical protein [Aquabacterium sp.]|uniref:hypothetical protein n=1 Tax=Aquabacterium sp. TaxID=1872578 RepID=UPI003784D8C3
MSRSVLRRLGLCSALVPPLAALTACYVVPIDPQTGRPVALPPPQPAQVTIVQPPQAVAAPSTALPALLQARLYPLNDVARGAGLVSATITDHHSGRGSISLVYRGLPMQGDATRVDGGYAAYGRIHAEVLGIDGRDGNGRRGIANAFGSNGVSAQCEYRLTGPSNGTGACLFSDGAKYQMHFGE